MTNIGIKFLQEIDNYLAKNWQSLECAVIYDIYSQFFEDLKKFKGNANGFTGLSEYLIFRFLYHLLGGSFNREKITHDLSKFVSQSNKNIWIGQNSRITIDNKKYYPDIIVCEHEKLLTVIQIKLYLTNGLQTVMTEVEILDSLKGKYPDMQALLLVYNTSKRGKIFSHLEKTKNDRSWFDFVILKQNSALLSKVLQNSLGLGRIRARLLSNS